MASDPPLHTARHRLSPAVIALAAASVVLHVLVNLWSPYGFHRDEFLYLAMGDHLRLWSMDFPPFIAVIANISRALLGESLAAIRFFPALAGALLIVIASDIARRLGGGMFAQILAAVAMLLPTIYLRPAGLFQPVVFDQLWWTLGMWCLLLWKQSGDNRWWIGIGAAMGVGLFTKFSILFFGFGVLTGLLATPDRRMLVTRWPWIALALTLAIGLPSIVGQIALGFPVTAQIADLQSSQLVRVSAVDFVTGQFMMLGLSTIVAVAGLIGLLLSRAFIQYRILGWTFVGAFAILLALHGKAYYLGPAYPAMIGAGAVIIESLGAGSGRIVFRGAITGVVVLGGLIGLPMGLPILPPLEMQGYAQALGVTSAVKTNTGDVLRLPQDYADMLGWEERVAAMAKAYHEIPLAARAETIIIAGNYGEAGAIDFLGPRLGLPHALCVSGSYWFFGPGTLPGNNALTIGIDKDDLRKYWNIVTPVAELRNEWTVPEERHLTIYYCEHARTSVQHLWPSFAGIN